MEAILNDISNALFAKPSGDLSVEELQLHTREHPYASALQLLLSQKMKGNDNSYADQWQKTLLYYNDPLMIDRLFKTGNAGVYNPVHKEPDPAPVADTLVQDNTPLIAEEPVEVVAEKESVVSDEEEMPELTIPGLKIEPLDAQQAALTFMPYHTVDYFASQGIKLGESAAKEDRFGTQLRSFTDWLKEMRRLPEAHVKTTISFRQEQLIENMAQQSVSGANVDTEAMALVWAQQGNPRKAIETYQKLSLQNPAKRAYFAAKIEHLKKSL